MLIICAEYGREARAGGRSTSPAAVDAFIDALKSPELTAILAETGLKRPPGF